MVKFKMVMVLLLVYGYSSAQLMKELNTMEAPMSNLNEEEKEFLYQYSEVKRWDAFYSEEKRQLLEEDPVFIPEWHNIGPNTIDTLSGRVISLAIHPSDPDILFAGSGAGGLWKSENAGESWFALTDELPSMRVSAVAINPNNTQELLIGTGIGRVLTTSLQPGVGVLKSIDGGNTWTTTSFSFNTTDLVSTYELIYDPIIPNKVYLAATNGFYFSNDGGDNWTKTNSNRIYDIEVHPTEEGTIYIGTQFIGLQKSIDGGNTWVTLNNGIPSGGQIFRTNLDLCHSNPEVVAVKFTNSNTFNSAGVYKSVDNGNSWTALTNVPDVNCQPSNPNSCSGWLFGTIGIAPDDPNRIYLGGVQFWYTEDNGNTWIWKDYASNGSGNNLGNKNLVYVDHWDIDFDLDRAGRVYVSCDGGVIRSDDYGESWTRMSKDLINTMCYSSATHAENAHYSIGGYHDHGLQRLMGDDGNLTWTRWSSNDGIKTLIDHQNPGVIYGNIQFGAVIKSFTNGSSPNTSFLVTNGIQEGGPWISPLVMHPENSSILLTASTAKIYRTMNGALNWNSVGAIPNVQSLEFDQANPNIVYAHAFNSNSWSFYRSNNAGQNWTQINSPSIPSWGTTALASDPHQEGRIFATRNSTIANNDHIKVSVDHGDSWTDITNDLPDIKVYDVLVSPYNPMHLFLATDFGVYFSENNGSNWCPFSNNLPRVQCMDLSISRADSMLQVATFGRGVWKTSLKALGDATVGIVEIIKPEVFEVYPNPVKHNLNLKLRLKSRMHVQLDLYSEEGKQVLKISDTYTSSIDDNIPIPQNLSSGIYYLKLRMSRYQYHKKLILVD